MIPAVNTHQLDTPLVAVPEIWEIPADFAETDAQDDGTLPALAHHFGIADSQHWIDLCA